jgi:hypothetical protein
MIQQQKQHGNAMQLQEQQIEAAKRVNAEKDRDVESMHNLQGIYQQNQGDLTKTLKDAAVSGKVLPNHIQQLEQHAAQLVETRAKTKAHEFERDKYNNDLTLGIFENLKNVSPDQYAAVFPSARQEFLKLHPDANVPDFVPQEQLGQYALPFQTMAGINAQAEEKRKAEEAKQKLQNEAATLLHTQAGTENLKAETPGKVATSAQTVRTTALGRMAGSQSQAAWTLNRKAVIAASPDLAAEIPEEFTPQNAKAVNNAALTAAQRSSDSNNQPPSVLRLAEIIADPNSTQEEVSKAKKMLEIDTAQKVAARPINQTNIAANNASGDAIDMMARSMMAGGSPPRSAALQVKAYERMAQIAKESGMDAEAAIATKNAAKANSMALNAVTKQYETLKPFADMAEKNADVLEKAMKGVNDLGVQFLNTPVRAIAKQFGGEKTSAFTAAILPVQADFARILNSPTGAGVLSDHARKEMQAAVQPGATVGQIKAAMDVFRTDARNRREAYNAEIKSLKERSSFSGAQQNQTEPSGTVQMKHPQTGKVGAVPADKVADAEKHGYKRVQ